MLDLKLLITKPNLWKRIAATVLDYMIIYLVFLVYLEIFGTTETDGSKSVKNLLVLPLVFFWFVYFVIIEGLYGATFAHQALNLTVLKKNRTEIDIPEALRRHLLDPIDLFLCGLPAIIAILKSNYHQRLGDMWANTIVVDTKDTEQFDPPVKWKTADKATKEQN